MTNGRESKEDIYHKQGKYSWLAETFTVYHCFSLTEYLSCLFFSTCIYSHPSRRRFWPKYLPLLFCYNRSIISTPIFPFIHPIWYHKFLSIWSRRANICTNYEKIIQEFIKHDLRPLFLEMKTITSAPVIFLILDFLYHLWIFLAELWRWITSSTNLYCIPKHFSTQLRSNSNTITQKRLAISKHFELLVFLEKFFFYINIRVICYSILGHIWMVRRQSSFDEFRTESSS